MQAMEAILEKHAAGRPGCLVEVNSPDGGLVLRVPGSGESTVLYSGTV